MNRPLALATAAATAVVLSIGSAAAQNVPPPGNVNPGSMRSGAEETGAPNQPRSFSYGSGYYGSAYGVAPGLGFAPGYNAFGA